MIELRRVDAENLWDIAARRLYESFGFEETGEMDGNEMIALLKWRKDK